MMDKSRKEIEGLLKISAFQITMIVIFFIIFHPLIYLEMIKAKEMFSLLISLLALAFLSDNVRFAFRGRRMISNVIGFLPIALIFGPFTAAIFSLIIVSVRIGIRNKGWKREIVSRLNRATHYAFIYFIAGILFYYLRSYNVIIASVIAITGYRLANTILIDYIEKERILGLHSFRRDYYLVFITDYILALSILPSVALLWITRNTIFELAAFYSLLPLLFMLHYTFNMEKLVNELKAERDKIKELNEKFTRLSEISNLVRLKTPPDKILSYIAKMMTKDFGYRYALINLFDMENDRSIRIAYSGFDKKEFERLQKNAPTVSSRFELMKDEFKMSNSYFIPQGAVEIKEEETYTGEYTRMNENGAWLPKDVFFVPLIDEKGIMIGYISLDSPLNGKRPTIMDARVLEIFASEVVTALKLSAKFQDIVYRSQIDLQTGLYNHTSFFEYLRTLLEHRSRHKKLYLLMLDMDNLKNINDKYGHLVGDRAIKRVVECIKSSVRKKDFVARYGGDEFVVILENVTFDTLRSIVDRIQLSRMFLKGVKEKLTVSIGVAAFPDDALKSKMLINQADKALYIAKNNGKARICFATNNKIRQKGEFL